MSEQPQLRMRHSLESLPGAPTLPDGYICRQATLADAATLDRLLLQAFCEGWREGQAIPELLDNPNVTTTWLIEHAGQVVATASYHLKPQEFPGSAWVHYVGADSAHSGKGLGLFVTWTVLSQAVETGRAEAYLSTDDWRLPAIRTYLKLGFEPVCWHESHSDRWSAVMETLQNAPTKAARSSPATTC